MKIYAVLDVKKNSVIALHNKRKIVDHYCSSMARFHNLDLDIIKISKSKLKKMNMYDDDLFLVRCGDAYVQAGYVDDYEAYSEQTIYDFQKTYDVLLRILETDDMHENERKHLEKAVIYINRRLHEEKEFVPELQKLISINLENEELRMSRTIWEEY